MIRVVSVLSFFVCQWCVAVEPFEQHVVASGYTAPIKRAEFFFWSETEQPRAVMVLCPGGNGNGYHMLNDTWKAFARANDLALCGVWLQSVRQPRDYADASLQSGGLLLQAVDSVYADFPQLILTGISAGAVFTGSFVEWRPDRVLTFAAQGGGYWVPPSPDAVDVPLGIVSSGEYDTHCWLLSLHHFQSGRRLGRDWTWVSIPDTGHARNATYEAFTRKFFQAVLDKEFEPVVYDITTKQKLTGGLSGIDQVDFTSWTPNQQIAKEWMLLHTP